MHNIDTRTVVEDFHFGILPINVSLLAGNGQSGMNAEIVIIMDVTHSHAGTFLGKERLFEYSLKVSKPRNNGGNDAFNIVRSTDLVNDAGQETSINNGKGLFGAHYDPLITLRLTIS